MFRILNIKMVVILVVLLSLSWTVSAFLQSPAPSYFQRLVRIHHRPYPATTTSTIIAKSFLFSFSLHSSKSNDDESCSHQIIKARDEFVTLAQTLATRSSAGKVFISSLTDASKFRDEFVRFESKVADYSSSLPSIHTSKRDYMLGDWTLIATANVPSQLLAGKTTVGVYDTDGTRTTKELNPIQKAIQRTINVTQRIRSIDDDESSKSGMIINRVDNVIELTPLTTLDGILPTDSPLTSSLNKVLDIVNPLKVQRAKIVLIHKAKVESIQPVLRTKIAYTSTVINVAGGDNTSSSSSPFIKLDPNGEDIFGINNVLGEFLNVGIFDTPFVDDTVRLSRTSGPVSEQLRVFVRQQGASSLPLTSNDDDDKAGVSAKVIELDADKIVEDEITTSSEVMSPSVSDDADEDFDDPFCLALPEADNDNEEE